MSQYDGRGEVLCYRQTGKRKAPPKEKHSEIGFYHKQTSWKAAKDEQSNYADNQDETGAYIYPKIDRINIRSDQPGGLLSLSAFRAFGNLMPAGEQVVSTPPGPAANGYKRWKPPEWGA
ncbi:MAG: hypothetical protein LBD44_01065 [Spirochaetaceae bacterium]|jgi:hypothetical protein|nr:hypothetical protein [Spirochaetaceae bacterium]